MISQSDRATTGPIGIIAGSGALPALLTRAARDQGRSVVLLYFGDSPPDGLPSQGDGDTSPDGVRHVYARWGGAVGAMHNLAQMGVRDIVMAGSLKRPSLAEMKPDLATAKVAARLLRSALGDDSLLRRLIGEIERMGFRVLPIEAFLPRLPSPCGVLGRLSPDSQAERDISHGLDVAARLGVADIGQAVVVQQGMVLAVEAIEGTAGLLQRCIGYSRPGPGGVLVKISKPGQDSRVDMPVIGPDTLEQAARAGLRGVAVEAERCLIVDRRKTVSIADAQGLFLVGVERARINSVIND